MDSTKTSFTTIFNQFSDELSKVQEKSKIPGVSKKEKRQLKTRENMLQKMMVDLQEKAALDPTYDPESYQDKYTLSLFMGSLLSGVGKDNDKDMIPIIDDSEFLNYLEHFEEIDEVYFNVEPQTLYVERNLERAVKEFSASTPEEKRTVDIESIPIYLLVVNSSASNPHATILILHNENVYSFGYGYAGADNFQMTKNVMTGNVCTLAKGSIYTIDYMLHPSKNPIQKGVEQRLANQLKQGEEVQLGTEVDVLINKDWVSGMVTDYSSGSYEVTFGDEELGKQYFDSTVIRPHREFGYLVKDIGIVTPEILKNIQSTMFGKKSKGVPNTSKTFEKGTIKKQLENEHSYMLDNDTTYQGIMPQPGTVPGAEQVCDIMQVFMQRRYNCVTFAQSIFGTKRISCWKKFGKLISVPVSNPNDCERKPAPLSREQFNRFIHIYTPSLTEATHRGTNNNQELFSLLDYDETYSRGRVRERQEPSTVRTDRSRSREKLGGKRRTRKRMYKTANKSKQTKTTTKRKVK